MKLFDDQFRKNKSQYVLQCMLATVSIVALQLVVGTMSSEVIVASFGASAFIAFGMPRSNVSRARFLIGGYVVGLVVGTLFYWLGPALSHVTDWSSGSMLSRTALASGSVGLAMFVMAITDTEHPPAAALALGVALNEDWHYLSVVGPLIGIVLMTLIKQLLKPVLKDLL